MATVKITQLPSASSGDITSNTDVLPIIDGDTTKQITVDNLFGTATHITASGVISSSKVDSEFSLYAHSASFNYISASTGDFDANTIRIGGSSFSKTDIDNLKAGKSISTDSNKKFVNSADDTTFVRMGDSGKAWHYIAGSPILKLGVGAINIGDSSTLTEIGAAGIGGGSSALIITGSSGMQVANGGLTAAAGMIVTGSTEMSGSVTVSGSFTVTDLLSVLANYGQTGSFSVSGSSTLDGDVNMDGQVTVTDLLTVLGGFGASGSCEVSGGLDVSGSGLVINGDNKALIVTGSTEMSGSVTVSGSFTVTDLLTVLANYGQTGSFSVSGSSTLDGDVNMDGQVTVTDLLTVLGGFGASGSCEVSGGLEISGSGLVINGDNKALIVTGSTVTSGSCVCTGSFEVDTLGGGFNVNNLLDLLSNFGNAGLPTGSAATGSEGGVGSGDINLDGQVNVNDMLLLLAGYGNPNCIVQDLTIPQNTNYQLVGPEICISQSVVVTVCNNSYFSIT